jgi:hypothetical protein
MSKISQWNDQALRLAGQVGETLKDVVPDRALRLADQVGVTLKDAVPDRALRWVETGAALGALRTGTRTAGKFVRRHPVALVAAAAGAGVVWYALRQRAKRKANGAWADEHTEDTGTTVEGRARRIEARRAHTTRSRRDTVNDEAPGASI